MNRFLNIIPSSTLYIKFCAKLLNTAAIIFFNQTKLFVSSNLEENAGILMSVLDDLYETIHVFECFMSLILDWFWTVRGCFFYAFWYQLITCISF